MMGVASQMTLNVVPGQKKHNFEVVHKISAFTSKYSLQRFAVSLSLMQFPPNPAVFSPHTFSLLLMRKSCNLCRHQTHFIERIAHRPDVIENFSKLYSYLVLKSESCFSVCLPCSATIGIRSLSIALWALSLACNHVIHKIKHPCPN